MMDAERPLKSQNVILDRNLIWSSGKRQTEDDLISYRNPYLETEILSPSYPGRWHLHGEFSTSQVFNDILGARKC
jgi:hypothetical protein